MQVPITALYAGLLAIYSIWLSSRPGLMRGKLGISILHGGNMDLAEKMRRHQNFVEYVPLALILIGVLEINGSSATFLHGLGAVLLIVRVSHANGLFHDNIGHPCARLVRQVQPSLPWLQASRQSGRVSRHFSCRNKK